MRMTVVMMMMMMVSTFALPSVARAAPLPELAWLSGDWHSCQNGEIVEERWLGPRGETMVGANLTSTQGKVSYEHLRITAADGAWTYWAAPMGRPEVPFRMIESGPQRVVFANPEHVF